MNAADKWVKEYLSEHFVKTPITIRGSLRMAFKAGQEAGPASKPCATCKGPLGDKHYSAVPDVGDLCMTCHDAWVKSVLRPAYEGSKNCKCGSIASGGDREFCSCDTCF